MTYAEYIHKNKKHYDGSTVDGNDIFNAFLLPYNRNNNKLLTNEEITYYGYSTCNWVINDDKNSYTFHKVALILVDTKTLIDSWIYNNKVNFNDLTKKIQKVK